MSVITNLRIRCRFRPCQRRHAICGCALGAPATQVDGGHACLKLLGGWWLSEEGEGFPGHSFVVVAHNPFIEICGLVEANVPYYRLYSGLPFEAVQYKIYEINETTSDSAGHDVYDPVVGDPVSWNKQVEFDCMDPDDVYPEVEVAVIIPNLRVEGVLVGVQGHFDIGEGQQPAEKTLPRNA